MKWVTFNPFHRSNVDPQYVFIMVAVLVVNHSKDLTPNHILEVYIAPLPNRIPKTHDNVQTKTLWCIISKSNQNTTCTWTFSAIIIVQVQVHAIIVHVQTLLVNFVLANSIQGTIISIIALTCFFYFFISCHALETGLLTRLFAVYTHKWQPPSRAVHVAAKIWTFCRGC